MAAYKFVQKLWSLNLEVIEKIKKDFKGNEQNDLEKITNKFIDKCNYNLSKFSYNKLIASFYEIYSELNKIMNKSYSPKTLKDNFIKIFVVMSPVLPHLANECLEMLNGNIDISWPKVNKKILIENNTNFVVQINGKKRGVLKTTKDISEEELVELIKNDKNLDKYLKDNIIKKKIFIPNKIINIII